MRSPHPSLPRAARLLLLLALFATREAGAQASDPRPGDPRIAPPMQDTTGTRRNAEFVDRSQLTRRLEREAMRLIDTQNALPPELTVRLRLEITADGLVDSITVLNSSGLPAADEAAIRVARPSLFRPAVVEGRAVRTFVVLPIRFVFPDG